MVNLVYAQPLIFPLRSPRILDLVTGGGTKVVNCGRQTTVAKCGGGLEMILSSAHFSPCVSVNFGIIYWGVVPTMGGGGVNA